jgi:LysM repeat protein
LYVAEQTIMNPTSHYLEDEYQSSAEEKAAELFAGALTRLDEGEAVDAILAELPTDVADELRSMLHLGEFMMSMQHLPVPVRNQARVATSRNAFLDQIALERTRKELERPLADKTPAEYIARPTSRTSTRRANAPAGWWRQLQEALTLGNMRLAPIVATFVIVFSSVFGLWRVSVASLPGDLVYPIKAWMQMMNLTLTSPENRGTAANEASATVQADIAESARRAEENAARDTQAASVRQETVFLVFEGFEGKLLKFGDIRVMPTWQADLASVSTSPMVVEGDLQPGAQVWLTIQIVPGQADVVQGVRALVQESDALAAPQPTPVTCTPQRPAGWRNYTVSRGDTLSALSLSTNATMRAIASANCLESDVILAGQLLYLPNGVQALPAPLLPLMPAATATPLFVEGGDVVQPAAVPALPQDAAPRP